MVISSDSVSPIPSDWSIMYSKPNTTRYSNRYRSRRRFVGRQAHDKSTPLQVQECLPKLGTSNNLPNLEKKRSPIYIPTERVGGTKSIFELPGIMSQTKPAYTDRRNSACETIMSNSSRTSTYRSGSFWKQGCSLSIPTVVISSETSDEETTLHVPRPPCSPRPSLETVAQGAQTKGTNGTIEVNSQRRKIKFINSSSHFEVTLQNIEEANLEVETESSPGGVQKPEEDPSSKQGQQCNHITQHQRSHSTPVDYWDLRDKLQDRPIQFVNISDMTAEFTKELLAQHEDHDNEDDRLTEKCITWLQTLDSDSQQK